MNRTILFGAAAGLSGAALVALLATKAVTPRGWKPVDASVLAESANLPKEISFNQHIQPILSANCYHCHGPDSGSRQAGLRLDRAEFAFAERKDTVPAITKNNLAASPLIQRILSKNPSEMMPPPDSHLKLTARDKALLDRWVREGAKYEAHWAFIPPRKSEPPVDADDKWSRTPIDRFVYAGLKAQGLPPSGPEDPRTLIRRVSLDLTGLLPDPKDADAFAADPSDAAYEAYVDKLIASSHFGEHRARYWLDYARYADTNGIHFDNNRSIWPYRDYVVRSFNENKPFDQFAREQLAGDLLPKANLDALIATGYVRCNLTTNEGGTILEEVAVNAARDRTEAFGATFLGLTVGCAACHDHKFDPTSQHDFYALTALLYNTQETAWDGNVADTPPVLRIPADQNHDAANALVAERSEAASELEKRTLNAQALFEEATKNGLHPEPVSTDKLELRLRLDEGKGDVVHNSAPGAKITEFKAGTNPPIWGETVWLWPSMRMDQSTTLELGDLGDFHADQPFSAGGWLMLRLDPAFADTGTGSLISRMGDPAYRGWDLFQDKGHFIVHIINEWPAKALKVQTKAAYPRGEWKHVFFTYDGSAKPAGVLLYVDGKPVELETMNDTLTPDMPIHSDAPLQLGRRQNGDLMRKTRFQDVRLYSRALSPEEVARLPFEERAAEILAAQPDPAKWSKDDRFAILDFWFLSNKDEPSAKLRQRIGELDTKIAELGKDQPTTLIAREKVTPPHANILARGVYSARGERVEPATPAFLPPLPKDRNPDRLALAEWLSTDSNPLFARVTANRMWAEVFGRGIVETPEDFGIMGARPTHPELLDWLAVDFRESGWDVKRFYKALVMSSVYRQSCKSTTAQLEKDAANRYLSHGPRYRMDAEMIRDTALQTAGLLADRAGGPPSKPYQAEGVWEAVSMPESDTKHYVADKGEGLYRRSLYTYWKRFAPPPAMETFDAPGRENVCARRTRTNTPLQALVMMNDTQFVEAARKLAERAITDNKEQDARLDFLAKETLSRSLDPSEKKTLLTSAEKFREHFEASPDDAKALLTVGESPAKPDLNPTELAEWTLVASQFYNLDEYLTK